MKFPIVTVSKVYKIKDNYLLYNSKKDKKFIVGSLITRILKDCNGSISLESITKKFSNIELKNVLDELENKGIIEFISKRFKKPKKLIFINSSPIEKIIWNITKKCNLKCKHCYVGNIDVRSPSALSKKDIKRTINQLNNKVLRITLTGGEPFLYKDLLELIKYIRDRDIGISLLTNGTLISKDIAEKLAKLEIYDLRVSLHGATPKTHDKFVGVEGAFNKTITGIKYLIERGVLVRITTNITPTSIRELSDFPKLLTKLGVKKWNISTFLPLGKAINLPHSCLDKKFLLNYIKKIAQISKQYKDIEIDYGFNLTRLNQMMNLKERPKFLRRPCFCRPLHMLINSNGDVHPCVWLEEIILGNIKQENIIKIMNGKRMEKFKKEFIPKNLKDCYKCKFFRLCGGGCRKIAKIYHEDLKAKDDTACIFFELFFTLILKDLNKKQKEFLFLYFQ